MIRIRTFVLLLLIVSTELLGLVVFQNIMMFIFSFNRKLYVAHEFNNVVFLC